MASSDLTSRAGPVTRDIEQVFVIFFCKLNLGLVYTDFFRFSVELEYLSLTYPLVRPKL